MCHLQCKHIYSYMHLLVHANWHAHILVHPICGAYTHLYIYIHSLQRVNERFLLNLKLILIILKNVKKDFYIYLCFFATNLLTCSFNLVPFLGIGDDKVSI